MFCTSCGTKNTLDSSFCKQCGYRLEKPASVKISEEEYDRALPEEEQVTALLERAYRARTGGDLTGAIALCEEALLLRPNSASVHSLLAQLYEQHGQRDRAIQELETVLQLNPGSIADRIKLDELRHGAKTAPQSHKIVSPQLALMERASMDVFTRVALAAVGIILLAGGTTYAMLRLNGATPPAANASVPKPTETLALLPKEVLPGAAISAGGAIQEAANQADPQTAVPSPNNPFAYYPPVGFSPAPTEAQNAPVTTRLASARAQRTAADTERIAPRPGRSLLPENANGGKEARILLPGEGGTGGSDNLVIRVNQADGGNAASPAGNPPGNGAESGTAIIQPIKTNPGGSAPGAGNANAADQQARSMLAIASNLMRQENYAGAMNAYRKALPTAGDQSGYVYQQIAVCHQRRGEKTSAITNYQKALNEYQKMLDSGKDSPLAKSGIRVCENGIKVCEGE